MDTGIPRHSSRQQAFIVVNILMIIATVLLGLFGFKLAMLFILPILGLMQLLSALIAAIRGSIIQAVYLIVGITYLVLLFLVGAGIIRLFHSISDLFSDTFFVVIVPLMMAIVYTGISFFEQPAQSRKMDRKGLLDDEFF